MIELKKVEILGFQITRAEYELKHSTPGANGTTLTQPLVMNVSGHVVNCKLTIDDCEAATPEEALEKMRLWCLRMAEALEERKANACALPFK